MKSFIRSNTDCVAQNKNKKQRNCRKSTAKSLAKLFKQESKQLDKVLESYDVVFDISPAVSSSDARPDKPYLTSNLTRAYGPQRTISSDFRGFWVSWGNRDLDGIGKEILQGDLRAGGRSRVESYI